MKNKNQVSVIMPCYNVESFVDNAIDSIKSQNYHNWEVIIIDDGSNDRTNEIIRKCIENDDRFILIEQKNKGVAAARNKGIEVAQGKYIYFFDPDDRLLPDLLKNTVEAIEKNSSDIVIFGYSKKDLLNQKTLVRNLDYQHSNYFKEDIVSLFLLLESNELFNPPWNKLFRAELIKENHIYFPEIRRGEDSIFNSKLFQVANKITFVPLPMYEYLVNRIGSVETVVSEDDHENYNRMMDAKKKMLLNFNYSDARIKIYSQQSNICTLYSDGIKIAKSSATKEEFLKYFKNRELYHNVKETRYSFKFHFKTLVKLYVVKNPIVLFFTKKR